MDRLGGRGAEGRDIVSAEGFSPAALIEMAERFRALGEPARLALLEALRNGEQSVGELVLITGQTQGNVSRHLAILHTAGLVSRRRDGIYVYYGVADDEVWTLCDLVCSRLRRGADEMRRAVG
ncbi:MAG: metalloregulator ArsR/SmtB family transcription factor [Gemmatimonadota bacterium]